MRRSQPPRTLHLSSSRIHKFWQKLDYQGFHVVLAFISQIYDIRYSDALEWLIPLKLRDRRTASDVSANSTASQEELVPISN